MRTLNFSAALRETLLGKFAGLGVLRKELHAQRRYHTYRGNENRFRYNS